MKKKNKPRLYNDLAWLWPIISPPEEYIEETEFFAKTVKQKHLPMLVCVKS